MKSTRFSLTWKDAGKALLIMVIGNILAMIMGLPEGQLPTWASIQLNLIASLKLAVIPYILKNFLTDDVKAAENTLMDAKK